MDIDYNNKDKVSEREDRLVKMLKLREVGINPYPSKIDYSHSVSEIVDNFLTIEREKGIVSSVGRLKAIRTHGNLSFAQLFGDGKDLQIAFSKKDLGDSYKNFVKLVDVGDFVWVEGECFVTHTGQNSLLVKNWKILTKALRPLPEKWHGLKDEEERYRKRYLDILMNSEVRDVLLKKVKFWEVVRTFMKDNGFVEVETPTLELTTGGAEANPFKTHHKDFDLDLFLRISAGELWQKRLMAAGFSKTFEIGRVYRNEGSSPEHLQEFTNMEFYWSYADYKDGMRLVKDLYQKIAREVFGKTDFNSKGYSFDLGGEWPEIDYRTEVKKQTGIDVLQDDEEKMKNKLAELKVKYDGNNKERLIDTLWKYCRKNIAGPVFLVNHPRIVSPLAKERSDNSDLTERFQVIIAGSEIGNGYSELNDPIDQANRFEVQQKLIESGDEEAMMSDLEFVEMLEHGMPPTCGFGFGERFFWILSGKSAREATFFPLMKPKNKDEN